MKPILRSSAIVLLVFALHYSGARLTGFGAPAENASDLHGFNFPTEVATTLPTWARPLAPTAYLFALTIAGIFAQTLWAPPRGSKRRRGGWWKAATRPLLASPVVLYGIIQIAQKQPDAVLAGLIAFQNGFFWKTVLKAREDDAEVGQ